MAEVKNKKRSSEPLTGRGGSIEQPKMGSVRLANGETALTVPANVFQDYGLGKGNAKEEDIE